MLASAARPGLNADWDFVWTQWGSKDINYTVIRLSPERRSPEQRRFLTESFVDMMSFPASKAVYEAQGFKELSAKLKQLKTEFPPLSRAQTVAETAEPRPTYLRVRGNYQENGVAVKPNTPAVLPPLTSAKPADRLTLARWLVSAENPLPARVFVSRVWQELFGRGLVASSENFGVTGDQPTYPELLDWLASEFRDHWSMKGLIRLIVTSAAYRQSSEARPELDAIDPQNSLFARQARLRLNAELIRDRALMAGGLLDSAIGGPSVHPPLPPGALDAALNARDPKQLWPESKGRDLYRRGVYIHQQRRLLYPQLAIFDQPGAAQSCTRRERSNTPLQALSLLNDPTILECARGFATRVVQQPSAAFQDRLNYAFRIALSRLPTEPESKRLHEYFQQRVEMLRQDPEMANRLYPARVLGTEPIDAAAWVGLGRVLMNLDEFITRE